MYIICVLLKHYFVQWYRKQLSREHLGKVLARLNYDTLTKNVNELKKERRNVICSAISVWRTKVNLIDLIVICCKSLLMTYMISVPLKPIRFKLISDYS